MVPFSPRELHSPPAAGRRSSDRQREMCHRREGAPVISIRRRAEGRCSSAVSQEREARRTRDPRASPSTHSFILSAAILILVYTDCHHKRRKTLVFVLFSFGTKGHTTYICAVCVFKFIFYFEDLFYLFYIFCFLW